MGEVWDWPNQQVVRADESGPGVDTSGGEPSPPDEAETLPTSSRG